ncbi:thymopoietin a isoform X3 [Centroberyx affinis]|uniref:thymopoietin a isoform X3 n=1 Tax=Centroberyx affinis TaxID=166261 RepID=UPI003A5C24C7
MPDYLDDPSVLTKDKLKSELLAHNVELPSGNPTKDVYVQLYLKNLTVQNKKNATLDAFSSDEELPPPVVSNRSRSSGRKATRKTDKTRPDDLDVTELTAEGLKDELLKYGVDAGPIVEPEAEPEPVPEPVPEPAPVAERPVRSRGKTPVTIRTRSSQHNKVEKIAASEQTPRADERDVLKEMFPNDINTPTGITATCRRPIRGAAGRPVTSSDLWNNENFLLSPKSLKTTSSSSSYTESRSVHRVTNLPPSTPSSSSSSSTTSSSSSRLVSAAPPTGQAKAARRSLSLWIKLFLLAIVAAFLFFVYQAMETNAINPFVDSDTEQISSNSAEPVASK